MGTVLEVALNAKLLVYKKKAYTLKKNSSERVNVYLIKIWDVILMNLAKDLKTNS